MFAVLNATKRRVCGTYPSVEEATAALPELLCDGDEYEIMVLADCAPGAGTLVESGVYRAE